MTKGLDAGHLDGVGLDCEGLDRSAVAAGGQRYLGLALLRVWTAGTEIEGPRLRGVEREAVSEVVGEARKVAGRVCCWREQMNGGR